MGPASGEIPVSNIILPGIKLTPAKEIIIVPKENLIPEGPIKVVGAGDSNTQGNVSHDWFNKVKQEVNYTDPDKFELYNMGFDSRTTESYIQEGKLSEIIKINPDIVELIIGTNNLNGSFRFPKRFTLEKYITDLNFIVNELKTKTNVSKIALASIPPFGEDPNEEIFKRSGEWSDAVKTLATETGCIYLPVHEMMVAQLALKNKDLKPKYSYNQWKVSFGMAVFDLKIVKKSLDDISKKQGHFLHSDLLHFNHSADDIFGVLTKGLVESYRKY